jgi:glycosyltransferase involved in cell wall biosynthesis
MRCSGTGEQEECSDDWRRRDPKRSWQCDTPIGRLTLISTTRPSLGDLESLIDRVRWSEATQHAMLAEFDLGIAPLADDPHTGGKCGYKLLQYGAAGTPAVASPIGANREILLRLGLSAAGDEAEWIDAIVDLLDRPC